MLTLSIAVGNRDIGTATVGNSRAGVVLDGAAALEGGTLVQEGSAVDGEGTVRGVVLDDRRSSTAERAGEGLDVVAGGEDAGEAGQHG